MHLKTAVRRFLTQLEADGRSPLTVQVYARELDRFARWAGVRKDVAAIRPETLAAYLTDPASRETPCGNARSTRTVNRTRTVLRLFFGYLADRGTIRQSPARLLRNGRSDRPIPTVLSRAEEKAIRVALDGAAKAGALGARDRALFLLLLGSGMRLSAALGLDAGDLDLKDGTAVSRVGKHGRCQRVFLPKDVSRVLKRHLGGATSGAVFQSSRGGRRTPDPSASRGRAPRSLDHLQVAATFRVLWRVQEPNGRLLRRR